MGQYYYIVNLDKRQFLHPHKFGDGLKLLEFSCSQGGTLAALAILLADGNGRGGGDLHSDNKIIGSWAGDRIVVAGDYADEEPGHLDPDDKVLEAYRKKVREENPETDKFNEPNLYTLCCNGFFEDISLKALEALLDDHYVASDYKKSAEEFPWSARHLTNKLRKKIGLPPVEKEEGE